MAVAAEAEVTINGLSTPLGDVPVWTTALDFLRDRGLTGCKEGCAEGECGACSVLIARPGVTTPTEWVAINACLVPIAALDGQEVITAEGLADGDTLHPVQHEMAVRGGSQCGYCTPGFVCSMAGEYYRPDRTPPGDGGDAEHGPNGFDLHALSGNLCRCTGYRPIRDAAYALGAPAGSDALAARSARPAPRQVATRLRRDGLSFIRPATLAEALEVLREQPEIAVDRRMHRPRGRGQPARHPARGGARDRAPAGAAGADDRRGADRDRRRAVADRDRAPARGSSGAARRAVRAVRLAVDPQRRDARRQPRHRLADRRQPAGAARAGRAGSCSRASTASARSRWPTTSPATGRACEAHELIRAVRIPLPLARLTAFHKIAKRRFDDISSVAVAVAIDHDDAGVVRRRPDRPRRRGRHPVRAAATEAALTGRPWSRQTVAAAAEMLGAEGTPMDDHRASTRYRAAMLRTSLLKLHADNPSSSRASKDGSSGLDEETAMSELASGRRDPAVGLEVPHESAVAARDRRGALHRRPRPPDQGRAARPPGADLARARAGHRAGHRAGARRAGRGAGAHRGRRARGQRRRRQARRAAVPAPRSCSTATRSAGCSARRSRRPGSARRPSRSRPSRCRPT